MLRQLLKALELNGGLDAPRLYLTLVIPMLLALNLVFVPFHAPDDYDHVKRAYSFGHGTLWPVTQSGKLTGGYIDANLALMIEAQKQAVHHWPRYGPLVPRDSPDAFPPVSPDMPWAGELVYSEFPGSASYLPLVYLPQTFALRLGEELGLSVQQSVFAARLLNGATAVFVIAWLLAKLPFGTGLILLVLLLPKTLVQFASNSADPILHALTLAVIVFACRVVVDGWRPNTEHFLLVALGLLALVGARPPLAVLALLPLWAAWQQRSLIAAAAILAPVIVGAAWFAAVIPMIVDLRCGPTGTFQGKVLAFLTQGPVLIARSLWAYKQYYFGSFVGELGWGDGPGGHLNRLPFWVYVAALLMFPLAIAHDLVRPVQAPADWRAVLLLCALGTAVLIFFAMYLGCTNPEKPTIGGVQGRYFVPSVVLVAIAFTGVLRPGDMVRRLYVPGLMVFVLSSFTALLSEGLRIYWTN